MCVKIFLCLLLAICAVMWVSSREQNPQPRVAVMLLKGRFSEELGGRDLNCLLLMQSTPTLPMRQ